MDNEHAYSAVTGKPVEEVRKMNKELEKFEYVGVFLTKWINDIKGQSKVMRSSQIAALIHHMHNRFPYETNLALISIHFFGNNVNNTMDLVKKMEDENGRGTKH